MLRQWRQFQTHTCSCCYMTKMPEPKSIYSPVSCGYILFSLLLKTIFPYEMSYQNPVTYCSNVAMHSNTICNMAHWTILFHPLCYHLTARTHMHARTYARAHTYTHACEHTHTHTHSHIWKLHVTHCRLYYMFGGKCHYKLMVLSQCVGRSTVCRKDVVS